MNTLLLCELLRRTAHIEIGCSKRLDEATHRVEGMIAEVRKVGAREVNHTLHVDLRVEAQHQHESTMCSC